MIKIGIIQFPGTNTERETSLALKRANMHSIDILWNDSINKISTCDGYIIAGGFSFEDRSRAGIIASLDPIMNIIKNESQKGKPVFGICNGAQILVESGLVPGVIDNKIGVSLADNKRIQNGYVMGTGYYNEWTYLKTSVSSQSTAFTKYLKKDELIHAPFAHAEGRFIIPKILLDELIKNEQTPFRYSDNKGYISNQFPINPNGSDYNLAAISNTSGNVLAMMPHPERTENGDKIFSSMKSYIEQGIQPTNKTLNYVPDKPIINKYEPEKNVVPWVIDLIITDNEAVSVQNAIDKLGIDLKISKQTLWELSISNNSSKVLEKIKLTGELFNSNKEYIGNFIKEKNVVTFLVQQKEDMHCKVKFDSIRERFDISELSKLKRGVLWNISSKNTNFDSEIDKLLETNILFNQLSHECFRIS